MAGDFDWYNPFNWFDNAPKAPEPDAPPDPGFLTKSFSSPYVSIPYAVGSGLLAASAPNYGTGKLAAGINTGLEFGMGAEKKEYERQKEKRLSDAFTKMMSPSMPTTVYAPAAGDPPQTEEQHLSILKSIPNTPEPVLTGKAGEYAKSVAAAGNPAAAMAFVGQQIGKDDNIQIVTLADGSKAYFEKSTRRLVPIPGSGKLASYRENLDASTKDRINYERELKGLDPIDTNLPLAIFARQAGMAPPSLTAPGEQTAPAPSVPAAVPAPQAGTVAAPAAPLATPTPVAAPGRGSFPANIDVRPGSATTQDRKTIGDIRTGQPYNVPATATPAQIKIVQDFLRGPGLPTPTGPEPSPTPAPAPPRVEVTMPSRIDAKGRPIFSQPTQPTGATSRIFADYQKEKKSEGWSDKQIREGWTTEQATLAKAKAEAAAQGGIAAKNTPAARNAAANVAGGTAEGGAKPRLDEKKNELDLKKMSGMTLDAKTGEVVSITEGDYARNPKGYVTLNANQERIKGGVDTAKTHMLVTSEFIGALPKNGLRITNALGQKISQLGNDPQSVALFQQLHSMTSLAAGSMLVAGGGGRPGVRLAEFLAPAGVTEGDTLATAVKKMQTWMKIGADNAKAAGIPIMPYEKATKEMNFNIIKSLVKEANGNVAQAKEEAKKLGLKLD